MLGGAISSNFMRNKSNTKHLQYIILENAKTYNSKQIYHANSK